MDSKSPHIENRNRLVKFIRAEMMGPCLEGDELDCSGEIIFENWEQARGPWMQKENGEEIIQRETPVNRYGIGVLYPRQAVHEEAGSAVGDESDGEIHNIEENEQKPVEIKPMGKREEGVSDDDDFDLSLAGTLQPSSMAVSFLADLPDESCLEIAVKGGRYLKKEVSISSTKRTWFMRQPVKIDGVVYSGKALKKQILPKPFIQAFDNGPTVSVECYSRPDIYTKNQESNDMRLITVCLVNRTTRQAATASEQSGLALFQAGFSVRAKQGARILPYPEAASEIQRTEAGMTDDDRERSSFRLLYRKKRTYAIGHGCAATWEDSSVQPPEVITADPLPEYEIPSVTPDARKADGSSLRISMAALAGEKSDGIRCLSEFINEYELWIQEKRAKINDFEPDLQEAAQRHVGNARACVERMKAGLSYLAEDEKAAEAFRLANRAVLVQQLRGGAKRSLTFDRSEKRKLFDPEYEDTDLENMPPDMGNWRAFQAGFILASLKSSILNTEERETVELIWFPTGGGKTEAYLGLAAFAMFYRRLVDQDDDGVNVLMRYTLRLLTTQQFQRAARLMCAMDKIRQENGNLGTKPFSIGIWVGADNTPNSKAAAVRAYNKMKGNRRAKNHFILRQCPWCGAEMGKRLEAGNSVSISGYTRKQNTVVFSCPDRKCPFHKSLPVHVIDEAIYQNRPSLIIGTVDKFAMLAWVPNAGSLFGLNEDGEKDKKPPGLIIQDELHLISGPLGTMVGLYETVIEELCKYDVDGQTVKPKIICSTGAIQKSYAE